MQTEILTKKGDLEAYDTWFQTRPHATLWQSLDWKKFQEALGREARIYVLKNDDGKIVASALVTIDKTKMNLCVFDCPRGPLFEKETDAHTLMKHIAENANHERAIALYMSPQKEFATHLHFKKSPRLEQPEATRIINLTQPEEKILSQMKEKGRYNIRVAQKHNVTVKMSKDMDAFYELLSATKGRDRFQIHSIAQYDQFLKSLPAFLLLAYAPNHKKPIAGLLGVLFGQQGIYYYGASDYSSRALMAPYLLQWEAMRHAKAAGKTEYDLLGIAPPDEIHTHAWSHISIFKEKFGGDVRTFPPEQELIIRPLAYKALKWKRKVWR